MSYTPINKGQYILESAERIAEFEAKRGHGVEHAYAENRRQWSENPTTRTVADYPLHVDLELASVCNLRCPMCYTITDDFKKRVNAKLMNFDLYLKLVDECAAGGVYSIRLSLRGESFLHPKVLDCIRYAKERGIPEVSSLTNGIRMDEAFFIKIMEAGLDWLTISIDGMNETYERIRRPGKFVEMLSRIKAFKRIKEEAGRIKPVIKVQSVFPAIAADPGAFYDTFAPHVDQVATNPLIDYLRNDLEAAILLHDDFCCPQLYQRLVIAADGQVLLCANDELNENVLGDANVETIHQIWHSPRMQQARALHAAHRGARELTPCRHCYLPRKTVPQEVAVGSREVIIENYINRPQEIGS